MANLRLVSGGGNDPISTKYPIYPIKYPIKYPEIRAADLTPELLSLAIACAREDGVEARAGQEKAIIPGLAHAYFDGGTLVSAGGILPIWPGLAQGWLIMTSLTTPRQLVAMTRIARAKFDAWNAMPAYRRIEIHIRADQPWRESFALAIGMTEEPALLRAWDARGRDWWLYARVA